MKKIISIYTLGFILISSFIFLSIIVQGKSLIATGDCYNQYYPALQYLANMVRSGMISSYDTAIGFGDDVVGALSYYGLGDILLLPAIFFSQEKMSYAYSMIAVLKMWLAGLSFLIYSRFKNVDKMLCVSGGIAYGLSFYMLQNGLSAYGFLTAPIYFPLMILGLEKVYREKKIKWGIELSLVVFLQGLNGFYFLYADIIVCLVYGIVLIVHDLYYKENIQNTLTSGLLTCCSFIVGIIMSSFLLIPAIMHFLQSQRSAESVSILSKMFSMLSLEEMIVRLKNIIFPSYGLYEYGFGVPMICIFIFIFLIMRPRKYAKYLIMYLIVAFGYFFPAIGTMMNGFSYNTSRWLYIAFFILLYIVVKVLPEVYTETLKRELFVYAVVCIVLLLVHIIVGDGTSLQTIIRTIIMAGVFVISIIVFMRHFYHAYPLMIVGNVALLGFMFFAPMKIGGLGTAASFVDYRDVYHDIFESEIYNFAKDNKYDSNQFYRIDYNDATLNSPAFMGVNSTFMYYSIYNGNMMNIFERLRVSPAINNSDNIEGLDSRQVLESIFSTVAYTDSYIDQDIKENMFYLPQGLFFDRAISEDEAEQYTYLQKMNLLMNTLIVQNDELAQNDNMVSQDDIGEQTALGYKVIKTENVNYMDGTISAKKGGYLVFEFDPIELSLVGDELYIEITNLQSDTKMWSDISLAGRTIRTRPIESEYYFNGNYDYLVNISSIANEGILKLDFIQGGDFSFDDIKIIRNTNVTFEDNYDQRLEHCIKNAIYQKNMINGTVNEDKDGYLMVNLPYSKKWKCIVDGTEQKIYIADYSFMAVHLTSGEHEVLFEYK